MKGNWLRRGALPALLFIAALSGCGSSGPYPVEGKVVWRDGTPARELAGSHVIFDLPEKQTSARGIIQADGSFRLTTQKENDGALPGKYKVLIVEANRKARGGGADPTEMEPTKMDSRYSDPSSSDLEAEVTRGSNKITLTVDRAPPPKG